VRHARERFTEVQALKAQGLSQMEIARCTGLARPTVHKYYTAAALEDVHLRGFEPRPSVLDPFKPYLYEHFRPGVTTIGALYRDLRDRGYTGSFNTVARYLATLRPAEPKPPRRGTDTPPPPPVPKARDLAAWTLTRPDHLDADDTAALDAACAASPPLGALRGYVARFAQILTERTGAQNLDAWLDAVEADDLADLRRFARGLRRDYDAVLAGLTLPDNSGAVEGNVTKLKLLKRQMYGRAKLDLLRKRTLLL
jgi:hypothetical protein